MYSTTSKLTQTDIHSVCARGKRIFCTIILSKIVVLILLTPIFMAEIFHKIKAWLLQCFDEREPSRFYREGCFGADG
jgi:hypothetical protein